MHLMRGRDLSGNWVIGVPHPAYGNLITLLAYYDGTTLCTEEVDPTTLVHALGAVDKEGELVWEGSFIKGTVMTPHIGRIMVVGWVHPNVHRTGYVLVNPNGIVQHNLNKVTIIEVGGSHPLPQYIQEFNRCSVAFCAA